MIVRYMPCLLPFFITVIAHCTKLSKLTHNNNESPKKILQNTFSFFYVNFNLGRIYGELHGFINMEEVKLMKTDCCG